MGTRQPRGTSLQISFNNITLGSILTVNESQEAFFFKNGTLCDSFVSGRHTLSSANLPVLQKLVNLASGGETTFMAEVWFISKLEKETCFGELVDYVLLIHISKYQSSYLLGTIWD